MARERKGSLVLRAKDLCALVTLVMAANCGGNSSTCGIQCPPGTTIDETGCACIQTGPVCDGGGPTEVQDGGPVLGSCCPSIALQSTARTAPTGSCTGSLPCFAAVIQSCPESASSDQSLIDEYTCACSGANWQCSLVSRGPGVCAPVDAGGMVDGGE